jgi:hypothetical protein
MRQERPHNPGIFMVLLQKSKSAIFDGCNPLKYRDTIFDKSVKNQFLQQNRLSRLWRGTRDPGKECCHEESIAFDPPR